MHTQQQARLLRFSVCMALAVVALLLVVPISAATPPASSQAPRSLIVVDTLDDELDDGGGDCSLREAIQAANLDLAVDGCAAGSGDDTIQLPAGTFGLSLPGIGEDANATGDLDVLTGTLSLVGAGAHDTVVNGQGSDRVLHVHVGASVEIQGVTLTGGLAKEDDVGGGIYNSGFLTLYLSVVTGNDAGGWPPETLHGGGIYNQGVLTLIQSTVSSNVSGSARLGLFMQDGGYGGGIYNTGRLQMIDSQVTNNRTGKGDERANYYPGSGGHGGGLYNAGSATVTNSSFSGNKTGMGGCASHAAGSGGDGGGVYNAGTLTLTHCSVATNRTGPGDTCMLAYGYKVKGGSGWGGGIHNGGVLFLSGSTIMDNATDDASRSGHGGGITSGNRFGGVTTRLVVVDSTISGNRAGYEADGGGIWNDGRLTLRNTTVAQNVAFRTGGGIYAGGIFTLTNTLFAENIANGAPGDCTKPDSGTFLSLGYNLAEVASSCPLTATGDITGTAACLEPLGSRGGGTPTHGLACGSPAIDAGNCPGSAADQRGFPRPVDFPGVPNVADTCDIGAFERGLYYYLPLAFCTSQ